MSTVIEKLNFGLNRIEKELTSLLNQKALLEQAINLHTEYKNTVKKLIIELQTETQNAR